MLEVLASIGDFLNQFAFETERLGDPEVIARLVLQVLLFTASASFSMSETALFSLSRLHLQKLRRERHKRAETLHELLDQPRQLIISILCGNELVNIAATVNLTGVLLLLYGDADTAGLVNVLLMFPLLLLFGEITPKTIAVSNPAGVSSNFVARPMAIWVRFVAPVRVGIRVVADSVTTLFVGESRNAENLLKIDEFRTLVDDASRAGVLNASEHKLIENILAAGETPVTSLMIPRPRIQFMSIAQAPVEMLETFRSMRLSQVPVYRDHRDTVVGMLTVERVLELAMEQRDPLDLTHDDLLVPALFVHNARTVDRMFEAFQSQNERAALVVNEYGGIDGMVTLRDILGFLFGELADQAPDPSLLKELGEERFEVSGQIDLDRLEEFTNIRIDDAEMVTLGGAIMHHLDRIPAVGDHAVFEDVAAFVLEMDGMRVARVLLQPIEDAAPEPIPEPEPAPEPESEPDPVPGPAPEEA